MSENNQTRLNNQIPPVRRTAVSLYSIATAIIMAIWAVTKSQENQKLQQEMQEVKAQFEELKESFRMIDEAVLNLEHSRNAAEREQ